MNKRLIVISLLFPLIANAQLVSDAKLWSGITINKEINDLEISFSEELRMDENASHIDKFFSEIGVQYKLIKGVYVSANYRYSRDNDYESRNYNMRHRVDFGLMYKRKIEKFRLSFRSKVQTKSALPDDNNPTFNRNKFTVKYKLENKLTPYVFYEFFYQFNNERIINRSRYSIGTSYKISDKTRVKLFYMYEDKFNTRNLEHNHIYGIYYSINL